MQVSSGQAQYLRLTYSGEKRPAKVREACREDAVRHHEKFLNSIVWLATLFLQSSISKRSRNTWLTCEDPSNSKKNVEGNWVFLNTRFIDRSSTSNMTRGLKGLIHLVPTLLSTLEDRGQSSLDFHCPCHGNTQLRTSLAFTRGLGKQKTLAPIPRFSQQFSTLSARLPTPYNSIRSKAPRTCMDLVGKLSQQLSAGNFTASYFCAPYVLCFSRTLAYSWCNRRLSGYLHDCVSQADGFQCHVIISLIGVIFRGRDATSRTQRFKELR